MKVYNSLTSKKEEFKSIKPNEVTIYICGPTVYNYIHIGNARPMVVFDTFRRVFEQLGYSVNFTSNYTDVDDKIINAAKAEGITELELANKYIEAYENDRKILNTIMPENRPRVTEYMPEIIAFIDDLIQKEYAYAIDGDVYFRVHKLDEYAILSKQNIDDLVVGARVEENDKKESPLDFTLWKATTDGINWESPWSKGRPGWHTECVVMINSIYNGEMIDIHGGGMDLKFPHHDNEIAQQQGCCHNNIANYWLHNGFINIDNEKMSKSLGNVIWTKDIVKEIGPNVFRLAMLSTHYRAPLNFNEELIDSTRKELDKLENALKQANLLLALNKYEGTPSLDETYMSKYMDAMSDDLNTALALTAIFDTLKAVNQQTRQKEINVELLASLKATLEKMLEIFGVIIPLKDIDHNDLVLYQSWLDAKADKDFDKADELRDVLVQANIL